MVLLHILFFSSLFYLVFLSFFYPLLLRALTRKRHLLRSPSKPSITVIIPTFNEEANIEEKLKNFMASSYPLENMGMMVVDNGSTDATQQKVEAMGIKLLKTERGKIKAINRGLEEAKTDLVVITDADCLVDETAIESLISCFSEPSIGAVGGMAEVEEGGNFFSKSKTQYHRLDWQLRALEGRLDTAISLDGKLMAFRRNLLPQISPQAVVDDLEVTFALRKRGYRSVVDEKALVYEKSPHGLEEELRQIRRRVAYTIPILWRHLSMLLNPGYGFFGMLIFPIRRFLAVLTPFFLLFYPLYLTLLLGPWSLLALLLLLSLAFLLGQSYPLIQQWGILLGWVDVLSGKVKKEAVWER